MTLSAGALGLLGALGGGVSGVTLIPLAVRFSRSSWLCWLLPPVCAALDAAALMLERSGAAAAVDLGLVAALSLLAVVDALTLRLPDVLTLPLVAAGLLEGAVVGGLAGRTSASLCGYAAFVLLAAAYRHRRGRSGLGAGDAKLFAAAGAWLGWEGLPQALLLASAIGVAGFAVRALLRGRGSLHRPLPFGPPLCVGIIVVRLISAAYGPG